MAPLTHPLTNTSSPMPPYGMTPATPFQAGSQTQWGPDSIGTIFFGILMFFMASVALWQGRQRVKQRDYDAEQGSRNDQSQRTTNATDPIPMADLSQGIPVIRVAASGNEPASNERQGDEPQKNKHQGDENETDQAFVPKTGQHMRTDTDWTLVGDEEDEGKQKDNEE